ncbi:tetratricopeptide repeat protein [Marinobacter subterrani]|uniref:tetratricopeptide repeat protein n=1 Tax=Marinobacter subterrani TaxID=1658765 RepID=UPI002353A7E9|nr:tetratricopeptide repeat protein [Marinobacter subterrani]
MLAHWLALSLSVLLVAPLGLQAAETDAGMEQLQDGIQSFESGNLQAARAHFENAIAAGLTSPSLFYNLGVTCYQLGDYAAAETAFRALLDGSSGFLARYNLGLVALERGDSRAARGWFEQSAADGSPDKIRALALAQLRKLGEAGQQSGRRTERRAYLALSGGYDSNIAGLPEASASSEGGIFLDALAAGTLEHPAGARSRFALEVAAYARKYPSEGNYDTRVLQGRAGWTETLVDGERGAVVSVVQSWFDSRSLERRYGVEGFYRWNRCPLPGNPDQCDVSLSAGTVNGGPGYAAYDGQWYRARLHALRYYRSWRFDGEYTLDINDRRDLRTAEEFISVSPYRHTLEVAARYRWRPDIVVGALGSVRHSRYQSPHVVLASAGESGRREDSRVEIGLLAEQSLNARWLVRGEWRVRDNSSSLAQYGYTRQTVMVTLEGAF